MKQFFSNHFILISLLSMSFLFLIFQGCSNDPKEETNPTDRTQYTDTISVEAKTVETGNVSIIKTFAGTLEGEQQANIIAKIPERIMKINVKVGDFVKSGEVLFELDKGGAQSQFYQAQAAYLNAQKNFERMENLLKAGAVSQQSFDAVQTQYEVAKANFDAARSTVEITSPLSGIVTAINVNIGDLASSLLPLATVANIGMMKAKFNVGESDVPSFFVGQSVDVYSEIRPELVISGKIIQLSKSANVQSRTFEMQATFQNTSDRWFKPGMFCRVKANMKTQTNTLTIPVASIVNLNNTEGVFVINDNKSQFQPIATGITNGTVTEVKSGLKEGDKIVTVGMSDLKNGTVVIITNQ
ncbi:MAG: efflux RND transporter periplasmic adaptor subunit [Ignavibacteriaceae bacterium]|jgi:RND family efflux transporter MFP subunit|nr:efflux RND transporter periplasmic adaptor subunit [Ignavibacteriaceae bacterium]